MTPARAAFEKARELGITPAGITWDALTADRRRKWADVAQAGSEELRARMAAVADDLDEAGAIMRSEAARLIRAGLEA